VSFVSKAISRSVTSNQEPPQCLSPDTARQHFRAAGHPKAAPSASPGCTGARICRKTKAGCARRAGVWLTADAPDILHPAGPGRRGGRAVGSLFSLEGGVGLRSEAMALMPAALAVASEDIAAGDVWIATRADGQIAGVVALAPGRAPGTLDLSKLFIDPRHIRGGVGRALLAHTLAETRRRGAERLTILADPNAAGSTSATARCRSARRPRTRCPAVCCRSMRSEPRSRFEMDDEILAVLVGVHCRSLRS
jgi:GNAT superfamily N-acetyltransferase